MIKRIPAVAALAGLALLVAPTPAQAGAKAKQLAKLAQRLKGHKGFMASDSPELTKLRELAEEAAAEDDATAGKVLFELTFMGCTSASVEVVMSEVGVDGLKQLKSDKARAIVHKKLNPKTLAALGGVVGAWNDAGSAEALGKMLGNKKDTRTVILAARALGKMRIKQAIKPLIDNYERWLKAGGEPIEAIGTALFDITGVSLDNAPAWEGWWKKVGKSWTVKDRPSGDSSTRPRSFQKKKPPKLFGSLEVKSKKIAIIMDVSGSMHIRTFIQEEELEKGSGKKKGVSLGGKAPQLPPGVDPTKDGYKPKHCGFTSSCPYAKGKGDDCGSDENLPYYYSRMARLSRHVQDLVRKLDGKTQFTMLSFSTGVTVWNKGLTSVAKKRKKAVGWLKGLRPNGVTNARSALEEAFKKVKDADTFIFVTDGAPTTGAGKPLDEEGMREVLDEVKRWNKHRKVRIDVIAIAQGHTSFSSGLAEENNGEYVTVD